MKSINDLVEQLRAATNNKRFPAVLCPGQLLLCTFEKADKRDWFLRRLEASVARFERVAKAKRIERVKRAKSPNYEPFD